MRLVALLNWYDERPEWLVELVGGIAAAGVNHLVAVDGAYALYPYGRARSNSDEAHALVGACAGVGIGLTLHQPEHVWLGNECEKRTAMFELGHRVAQPGTDWFWVCDGDEIVTEARTLREQLASAKHDAGECVVWWEKPDGIKTYKMIRKFFRAQPDGISVTDNHYTYVAGDGRRLWGNLPREDCERLWGVEIEHRLAKRTGPRLDAQHEYYRRRKDEKIELEPH